MFKFFSRALGLEAKTPYVKIDQGQAKLMEDITREREALSRQASLLSSTQASFAARQNEAIAAMTNASQASIAGPDAATISGAAAAPVISTGDDPTVMKKRGRAGLRIDLLGGAPTGLNNPLG